jgi:mRNA-degrading endonuclease RelE of RelBE toxin-antitoxin system
MPGLPDRHERQEIFTPCFACGPLDDRFSARSGTYRVIYRIDEKAHIVTVVDIGHRCGVYRT